MTDADLHDQVSRIEANIQHLIEALERCRKVGLVSKVAIAAGGVWLLALTSGVIAYNAVATVAALAFVIGGVVVFGSNTSTSKQMTVAIKTAEARRAGLIDRINPRLVTKAEE